MCFDVAAISRSIPVFLLAICLFIGHVNTSVFFFFGWHFKHMARPQLQDEVTQISGTLKWITGPKFIKKNMSRNPQICHPKSNHPMNDFSKLFFFPSPDWPTHAADAECMGWGGQGGRFGSVSHGNDEQKRDIVGKNHVFSIFKVTQKRIQNFSGSWTYCSIIFLAGTTVPNWGRGTEFMDIWDASTGKLMMKHWISGVTHPWTGRDGDFTWTVWSAEGGQSSSLMMQVLRLNGWKLILNGTVHSCLMRAYNQISKGWSGVKVRVPHAQEAQLLKQFWAMYG